MKNSSSRRDFIKKSTLAATALSFGVTGCNRNSKHKTTDAVTHEERREQLYSLLCDLPPRNRGISAKIDSVEHKNGYRLEKLSLDLNGQQQVPAWFAPCRGG